MGETQPRDDRPRFGLMDVFAVVAAFAVAFKLVEPLRDFQAEVRAPISSSFRPIRERPSPPPQVAPGNDLTYFFIALPLGLFMAQPLALASQFAFRRRRLRPLRLELFGAIPGCLSLVVIALLTAIAHEFPAMAYLVLGLAFCGFGAGLGLFLYPGQRVTPTLAWTDWYGIAMVFVCWCAFMSVLGVAFG